MMKFEAGYSATSIVLKIDHRGFEINIADHVVFSDKINPANKPDIRIYWDKINDVTSLICSLNGNLRDDDYIAGTGENLAHVMQTIDKIITIVKW